MNLIPGPLERERREPDAVVLCEKRMYHFVVTYYVLLLKLFELLFELLFERTVGCHKDIFEQFCSLVSSVRVCFLSLRSVVYGSVILRKFLRDNAVSQKVRILVLAVSFHFTF